MSATLTPDAIALIEGFEGCSLHPEWPGFSSGVTLGYGVDIGADPAGLDAWEPYVSAADFARLEKAKGVTGEAAKPLAASLKDITITETQAQTVLATVTLPRYIDATLKAFPGADALPDDSFGALVSLVFNRGGATTGKNRAEMAVIKTDVAAGSGQWWDIVVQLAKMVVYWNYSRYAITHCIAWYFAIVTFFVKNTTGACARINFQLLVNFYVEEKARTTEVVT